MELGYRHAGVGPLTDSVAGYSADYAEIDTDFECLQPLIMPEALYEQYDSTQAFPIVKFSNLLLRRALLYFAGAASRVIESVSRGRQQAFPVELCGRVSLHLGSSRIMT